MRVGLDIGSTTIKCVVLNDAGEIVFSTYRRKNTNIFWKGAGALLEKVAAEYLPDGKAYLTISARPAWAWRTDSCKGPRAGGLCDPRGRQPSGARHRLHH